MMIAPGMLADRREAMRRAAGSDPATYARWPGIAGCTTKMLIGRHCASPHIPTDADTERAIFIVREQFAFVGLREQWSASVCVFHAMLSPNTPIHTAELAVTHVGVATTSRSSTNNSLSAYDERPLGKFVDSLDERVYAAARGRFRTDLRRTQCGRLAKV